VLNTLQVPSQNRFQATPQATKEQMKTTVHLWTLLDNEVFVETFASVLVE
jgi:hypothetical protein